MPALEHPSEAKLAAVLNEAMAPEEVERILEHLDECKRCEERLEELEPAIAEYRSFRERITPQLPRPTRPWPDLQAEMDRMDRRPSKLRRIAAEPKPVTMAAPHSRHAFNAKWMSAIAAGVLVCGWIFWPRSGTLLRAETLLQASMSAVSHAASRSRSHVRVKTRTASFLRPAVLHGAGGPGNLDAVRSKFQAAHYDWNDPLNPRAFAEWRSTVPDKADRVSSSGREYTIATTAPQGALREAALTIQSSDMLPVSGRFQFADAEWVEIAAVPDSAEAPPPVATAPTLPSSAPAPGVQQPALSGAALAERELEVRSAIDHAQGGAIPPVGIETESGHVVVTIYNLAPQQEGQLRAVLESMEGVIIRSQGRGPDSGPDAPTASPSGVAAPFPAIDTSEAIVSRAHLLNRLSERFPPELEASLSAQSRGLLAELRSRQAAAINREIELLHTQLSSTRPLSVAQEPPPRQASGSSPPPVTALIQAASSVHRLVTSIYAGGVGQVDAASAWPELAGELARLRASTRQLQ